jgi:hypothetical protein
MAFTLRCPGFNLNGPPPTMSVTRRKLPRGLNSTVVPTASPTAKPSRQPRNLFEPLLVMKIRYQIGLRMSPKIALIACDSYSFGVGLNKYLLIKTPS